jgi:3-phenylpropionate/trans-cinnamate dioxygenase ferredoxin reductase component
MFIVPRKPARIARIAGVPYTYSGSICNLDHEHPYSVYSVYSILTLVDAGIVVVGAGHAGGVLAALLRQNGYGGEIVLLGEEALPPYQRPPLSKAWLKGKAAAEDLALRPAAFYREAGIDLRTGTRVEALDRAARQILLRGGERIQYHRAVLATGARPIRLSVPGSRLDGVLTLRTTEDAEALKARLGPRKRVAIIGGGYIGLEVAASVVGLGGRALVLERAPRLLGRSASTPVADFLHRYHETRGVRVQVEAKVVAFVGDGAAVSGVRLANGTVEPCDLVLLGVGIVPNLELARAAGLVCDRGVRVDEHCRTSDPLVYAIGDCSHRPSLIYGRMVCPESVPSAIEQAKQVAAHLLGRSAPPPEVPWNWSDQYDLKLQVAGFPFDVDQMVVRGDPASASFAVFHLMDRRVRQVEAINAASEFMAGRQLIQRQTQIDALRLADRAVPMKALAA